MAVLQLLRLPGVFTAVGNVLAGYFFARFFGAGVGNVFALPYLLGASACLYSAGMAWNDIFDYEADCRARPERPLPSGRISYTAAFMLAAGLSCAGLLLAMRAGVTSFLCASALLSLILLYNGGGKHLEVTGPVTMGGCRGLNLLLGMTAHSYVLILLASEPLLWVPPFLLMAYTIVITLLALLEDVAPPAVMEDAHDDSAESVAFDSDAETQMIVTTNDDRDCEDNKLLEHGNAAASPEPERLVTAPRDANSWLLACSAGALLLVPLGAIWVLPYRPLGLAFFLFLLLLLVSRLYRVFLASSTLAIRRLVGGAIFGMALLDAGFVASMSAGFYPSREETAGVVLIVAMMIPAWLLRKRLTVT